MLKIVIDTNVIISATISKQGVSAKIIQTWKENKFHLIISPNILKELAFPRRFHVSINERRDYEDITICDILEVL